MFMNVLNISASHCILSSCGLQIVSDMFSLFPKDWFAQKTQDLVLFLLSWLSKHEILLMKGKDTCFIPVKTYNY